MQTPTPRPWHWLRKNHGTSIPTLVTVFACDCHCEEVPGKVLRERRTLRAWSATTYRTDRKNAFESTAYGNEPAAFWAYLKGQKRKKMSHWVFAHQLKDYLTWLEFWAMLDARKILIHKAGDHDFERQGRLWWTKPGWAGALILSDPPTWIKCRWEPGVLNLCDIRNYVNAELDEFAASAGLELPADVDQGAGLVEVAANLKAETAVVWEWLRGLLNTWESESLGCWRPTGSGLAWNAYRHRFLDEKSVLIHGNPEAIKLERASYFGGRCIVGYVGEVKEARERGKARAIGKTPFDPSPARGPVSEFDINSNYAAVMKRYEYPCKLCCVRSTISEAQLAAWVHQYCLIAAVLVDSPERAYPLRIGKRVYWRTGKFWVVLTTGELQDAMERGLIRAIGQTAIYEKAKLFPGYVDWAFEKKSLPDTPANQVNREFGKVLTTSLYGRWGQVRQGWNDLPGVDANGVWGTFGYSPGKGLEPSLYRAVGCAVQEFFREGETLDSFPAVAAHVTAYARLLADFWLDQLPPKTLLYHDTDSFHVLPAGASWITARPASVGLLLEQLRLERQAPTAQYFGQKHYRLGDTYKLGSQSRARRWIEGDTWEVDTAEPIDSLLTRPLDGSTMLTRELRTVEAMPVGREIGADGWTKPISFQGADWQGWKDQDRVLTAVVSGQGQEQAVQAAMQSAMLF